MRTTEQIPVNLNTIVRAELKQSGKETLDRYRTALMGHIGSNVSLNTRKDIEKHFTGQTLATEGWPFHELVEVFGDSMERLSVESPFVDNCFTLTLSVLYSSAVQTQG